MSELHAAMGLAVLPSVPEIIASRRVRSSWYDDMLEGLSLQRPNVIPGLEYNYAYYPVAFSTHDDMLKVRTALKVKGVFPRRYFSPSLNTLTFLRENLRRSCPVSESLAQRILALPLYPTLSREEVDMISSCIKKTLQISN